MEQYAQGNSFKYMNYTVKPPSIWERISWWFKRMFEKLFLNPNTPLYTRLLYYLILAVVIGAVLYYIVRLKYAGALSPESPNYKSGIQGLTQTKEEDFDRLISESLESGNFKLAIRYLYLKTLLTLSKKELIKLREWKSPYDYERELKSEVANSYRELARLFEYVWYGDFEAGERDFSKGNELSKRLEEAA